MNRPIVEVDAAADARAAGEPAAPPIELVLVGERPTAQRDDAFYVATIEEAAAQLREHPEVSTIEVALNGPLACQPLRFVLTHPVTVRAAAGYSPMLVFTPEMPAWSGRRRMAAIEGAMLTMEGMHLALLSPEDWTNDWALFCLRRGGGLTLNGCTATIVADPHARDQNVTFFELADDRLAAMGMLNGGVEPTAPIEVSCVRSILRGPAVVLRCPLRRVV